MSTILLILTAVALYFALTTIESNPENTVEILLIAIVAMLTAIYYRLGEK